MADIFHIFSHNQASENRLQQLIAHTPDTASLELARPAGGNGGGVRRAGLFSGVSRASGAFGASARAGCPCKGGSIRARSPARRQGHPPTGRVQE